MAGNGKFQEMKQRMLDERELKNNRLRIQVLEEENKELREFGEKITLKTREEIRGEYEKKIEELKTDLNLAESKLKSNQRKSESDVKELRDKLDKKDDKIREIQFSAKDEKYNLELKIRDLEYERDLETRDIATNPQFIELQKEKAILEARVKMLEEQAQFYGENSQMVLGAMMGKAASSVKALPSSEVR